MTLQIKKNGKVVGTIVNNKLHSLDKTLKGILSNNIGEQPFEDGKVIGTKPVYESNFGIVVVNNRLDLLAEGYEIE